MSTMLVSSHCTSCGEKIFGTRFCDSCGQPVDAVAAPAPVPDPAPTLAQSPVLTPESPSTHSAPDAVDSEAAVSQAVGNAMRRVRLGLLVALNAFIWTPIVPTMTIVAINWVGQSLGRGWLQGEVWPIIVVAGLVAPTLMVTALVLAAKAAAISPKARRSSMVLAAFAGVLNALGVILAASSFGAPFAATPGLGSLAAIGAWGLIARFRGAGYWALAYAVAAGLLFAVVSGFSYLPVLLALSFVLWALVVLGVVRLALAHERRADRRSMEAASARSTAVAYSGRTNGFAVASIVLALLGGGIFAIVFGHVARSQIRLSGDGGSGMATAGLVIGYVSIVLSVISTLLVGFLISTGAWR